MQRFLLLILLLSTAAAYAQESKDGSVKPARLFSSEDTLAVTITAPWRDMVRNKKNQEPYPATLEYTDELGNSLTLDITASRRGITRQRVCRFPPIKLHFNKEEVKGTTFRGQKSLKMVTHCEKASRYKQYYILEMLAYQMYNLITDYSFRIRPLEVSYVDSKTGKTDKQRFAFLIEDDSDVAKRHDLKKLNIPKVKSSQLATKVISDFSLFQYMIGNVDWAALSGPKTNECCHNAKLIGPEPLQAKDKAYPIPYDFDSAGLVDAHYAAPPDGLGINSVTQRLYRGYCLYNSGLEDARQKSLAQENAVYALVTNEARLTSGSKKKATKFLKRYYDLIKNDKEFEKKVIGKCRK